MLRGGACGGPALTACKAECKRLREERDAFAAQFEELARLRNTGAEELLEKFKQRAEARAKGEGSLCVRGLRTH